MTKKNDGKYLNFDGITQSSFRMSNRELLSFHKRIVKGRKLLINKTQAIRIAMRLVTNMTDAQLLAAKENGLLREPDVEVSDWKFYNLNKTINLLEEEEKGLI